MKQAFTVFSVLLLFTLSTAAQSVYTLSGTISDSETGEALIGAVAYIAAEEAGVSTNSYGFYSIKVKKGVYKVAFSYLGYETKNLEIDIKSDKKLNIELKPSTQKLEEVVVVGQKKDKNVTSIEMSVNTLPLKTIKSLPSFMGEVDILKSIQMLPGVQNVSEGSTGFSVRGGDVDQNLILLDEATVYNAGHLMGFFSVFNNDVIKDVKLYKGNIPAYSGGRLSSLLDVRMKEGNNKKYEAKGGIGTIASRLTIEGPIVKDKGSFLISGRRTYADLFIPLMNNDDLKDSKLYFYDLNTKLNYKINDNNRVYMSGYFGRDVFGSSFASMGFGNQTYTTRWNHIFNQNLFANLSFIHSVYDYEMGFKTEDKTMGVDINSKIKDYTGKLDFTHYAMNKLKLKYGVSATYHRFNPGYLENTGTNQIFDNKDIHNQNSMEYALYLSGDYEIVKNLKATIGLRYSIFQNIGKGTVYQYDDNYESNVSVSYPSGEVFNTYSGAEPRIGVNYTINNQNSVKASYSRTMQYLQLARNSNGGSPLDIWFTASPNVKPQISDQWAVGYFRNMFDNKLELSTEVFYKNMKNTIDFKDHAQLVLNNKLEGELRVGDSYSYGFEFMGTYTSNKITGWVSYTYSKARRKIPELNNGKEYNSPFDKPHVLNIAANWNVTNRLSVGLTWVYNTGAPVTLPNQRFEVDNTILPVYGSKNSERLPDYHRMDLSVTLKSKPKRRFQSEWNFSLYNLYGRKNAYSISFKPSDKNEAHTVYAYKTYLFTFVPSITYNFKF
jgi:hypothetical protein